MIVKTPVNLVCAIKTETHGLVKIPRGLVRFQNPKRDRCEIINPGGFQGAPAKRAARAFAPMIRMDVDRHDFGNRFWIGILIPGRNEIAKPDDSIFASATKILCF